ncbi:MAG: phosphorylase [Rhodospirillales bacterium]|nr:phosphorylase [Rhodospirillales bacterium]
MGPGVVTGLAREAACLDVVPEGERARVGCAGMGPRAAASAACDLLKSGCTGLVSFGVAGALVPDLRAGDLVIADAVVSASGEVLACDIPWRQRLGSRMSGRHTGGLLAGSDAPLFGAKDKRLLADASGACAVDMESHAVADIARRAGVPFVTIRAIVDPLERSIPAWVAGGIDAYGRPRLTRLIAGIAAHPGDLKTLLRLGREQACALKTLRRAALDAGAFLAFD